MTARISLDQDALEAKRAVLVQRLEDGDRRIVAARESGADTDHWEAFWLHLLEEYVTVSRQLDSAEPVALDVAA